MVCLDARWLLHQLCASAKVRRQRQGRLVGVTLHASGGRARLTTSVLPGLPFSRFTELQPVHDFGKQSTFQAWSCQLATHQYTQWRPLVVFTSLEPGAKPTDADWQYLAEAMRWARDSGFPALLVFVLPCAPPADVETASAQAQNAVIAASATVLTASIVVKEAAGPLPSADRVQTHWQLEVARVCRHARVCTGLVELANAIDTFVHLLEFARFVSHGRPVPHPADLLWCGDPDRRRCMCTWASPGDMFDGSEITPAGEVADGLVMGRARLGGLPLGVMVCTEPQVWCDRFVERLEQLLLECLSAVEDLPVLLLLDVQVEGQHPVRAGLLHHVMQLLHAMDRSTVAVALRSDSGWPICAEQLLHGLPTHRVPAEQGRQFWFWKLRRLELQRRLLRIFRKVHAEAETHLRALFGEEVWHDDQSWCEWLQRHHTLVQGSKHLLQMRLSCVADVRQASSTALSLLFQDLTIEGDLPRQDR